jgi:hypothetical protein
MEVVMDLMMEDMRRLDEATTTDDWGGLPAPGTRVRVPHLTGTIDGEIMLRYRLFGNPVAKVRVWLPASHEPYRTRAVNVAFHRHEMEIIAN